MEFAWYHDYRVEVRWFKTRFEAHSTEKSTSQVRPPSSVGPSGTLISITMIKFVIFVALVGLVTCRNIEETKANDKVASGKSNTGVEDSAAATRSNNVDKKKPYGIRDYYDDVEYGHDYEDSASTYGDKVQVYKAQPYKYGYHVKDDYSYNIQDKYEETDDAGVVHGYYSAQLPDGRLQQVTYTVDHYSGYVPVVRYVGEAKYPAATYDEEYDGAYKGDYKKDYKGYKTGDKYGYQPTKQAYKKPPY